MKDNQVIWGSRIGFILAAMGMAVGTGNIWRFPRMVAEHGGGSFLIGWAFFLFLWSLPLIMVEVFIGRKTRMGTMGSFGEFIGKKFAWFGPIITIVLAGITFYYSVVVGWTFKYFILALQGTFTEKIDSAAQWENFVGHSAEPVIFHFIAAVLCGVVVFIGVTKGIERMSKLFLPLLFLLLIFTAFRSVTLPGAMEGLSYMFTPQWEYLGKASTWLQALSQSAWSVGAGWGLYATYAIYTKKRDDIAQNSLTAGLGNNSVELLAGLTIIPAIFALAPSQEYITQATSSGNTGLTFIYMVELLNVMPQTYIFGIAFFGALAFAAFTSLVAMVELITRNLSDYGIRRNKAIVLTVALIFIGGIPSALNMKIFNNQDWVWGVGLLLSCFLYSYAAIKYGVEKMRDEINEVSFIKVNKWWVYSIKYFIPALFVIVTGWWLYQGVTWYPDTWWKPFEEFNVGTIVLQLGAAFLLAFGLLRFNSKLRSSVKEEGLSDRESSMPSNTDIKEEL
ncbi:NSS family neurotransmitter:Na+ symporter [Cytobacillus oceanisediminis]|uniref:NSS family neurotransmitter:Na+ symporter n=1 Tax=Cytobacillus oceanisediminis TaxID=665099 RepID=A0A2V3AA37_9BACI|nr:sodium-dependent transporter [Cytobacillus oceanisediminis]PWW32124.1 NSS family neurotransmitter:Na+ symporter [Cytobacillus oceanisediminis]